MNRTTITIGLAAVLATAGTGAAVAATGGSASSTASHVVSSVRGSDDPVGHDRFDDRLANLRGSQAEDQAGHHRRHGHAEAGDDRGGRGELEPGDDRRGRGEVEAGDDRGDALDAVDAVVAGGDGSGRDGSGRDGSGSADGGSGSADSGSGSDDGGSGHHDGRDG
jgi:hypothetical protein